MEQATINTRKFICPFISALTLQRSSSSDALTHLAHVPISKDLEVNLEGAVMDDPIIAGLVEVLAKKDVLPQAQVLAPGNLGDVGH